MQYRRIIGVVVLLIAGTIIGIIGERTYWFGLRRRSLNAASCSAVKIWAPYSAWDVVLNADGSAVMRRGFGVGVGGCGFAGHLRNDDAPECRLPEGSLNFSKTCQELLAERSFDNVTAILDYSEMPFHVLFFPSDATERYDPLMRARYIYDFVDGTISPAQGSKLFDSMIRIAREQGLWPESYEELMPYPPIPWTKNLGVPGKLRVKFAD